MIWGVAVLLVILIILVVMLLKRMRSPDYSSRFDAALKEQFLQFQSSIHNELNSTREEVNRSKDLISEHAIKTIDTIKDMGSTINRIVQQQEEAHKLGQSLKDLLQAPKLRGNYGEAILEEMLERVLPRNIWEKQYQIEEGKKVDAVVRVRGIVIPIDSKFPRDDYQRYCEAPDPEDKRRYWKDHETAVKNQIKSINGKYIKPERGTSDFALMFIPSEAIYYETIAEKNYLGEPSAVYEYALSNNVIPVSPNTFYAFLQVLVMGIKNIEIVKSAKKLQENLVAVQKSFSQFYRNYEDIGKNLSKASESFRKADTHIDRYRKKLESTLQLEELNEDLAAIEDKEKEV
ncbi:MAG: DNA recombination protein RmuC [Elusimicrobia bacterium]|nr:DNA recombination protein RmuC [Elusimicrobiota bacterium]